MQIELDEGILSFAIPEFEASLKLPSIRSKYCIQGAVIRDGRLEVRPYTQEYTESEVGASLDRHREHLDKWVPADDSKGDVFLFWSVIGDSYWHGLMARPGDETPLLEVKCHHPSDGQWYVSQFRYKDAATVISDSEGQ